MRVLPQLWCGLALVVVASSCFLNSCPYRRYGRAPRCSSCGTTMEGICVKGSLCCTQDRCIISEDCPLAAPCPERFCRMATQLYAPGYCVKDRLCCNADGCEETAMCF